MPDTIRNKLWADIYAQAHAKGRIWFQCKEEADRAIDSYDRRPEARTSPSQPTEGRTA